MDAVAQIPPSYCRSSAALKQSPKHHTAMPIICYPIALALFVVKIKELDSYLSDEVERLSRGVQTPILHAPAGLKNFVISRQE